MPKGIGCKGKSRERKKSFQDQNNNPLLEETVGSSLDLMTFERFKTWSEGSLRYYLALRKQSVGGTHEELAARAFVQWESNAVSVHPSQEHALRQNLSDYKDKLRINSTVLPDPYSLQEGWINEGTGKQFWPSLYFSDITHLLQMTTPSELYHRLCNEYKQGKAFRMFSYGHVQEVCYHPISATSDICFLASKCRPSMRTGFYECWVALMKDTKDSPHGEVVSSYCTCTAGLKGSCNHIVGLLFKVEYAVRSGLTDPACTSKSCVWNVPRQSEMTEVIKLCEQTWSKDKYLSEGEKPHNSSVRQLATTFSPSSDSQQQYLASDKAGDDLANLLRSVAPKSSFIQLYDKKPFLKKVTTPCPDPPIKVAKKMGYPSNSTKANSDELANAMRLSEEQVRIIEDATREQADCTEWVEQRKGRITASIFKRASTRSITLQNKPEESSRSIVKEIMGYNPAINTKATKHGKNLEPRAKIEYCKIMRKRHNKFSTNNCGLIVSEEHSFLGASPDLVVCCKCKNNCGDGLCEIKCPEAIKGQQPSPDNLKEHIAYENGQAKLRRESSYYYQMQGQMAIAKRSYCDIFVYCGPNKYFLQRVSFDPVFWEAVLSDLSFLWHYHVAEELLSGSIFATLSTEMEQDVVGLDHTYMCTGPQLSVCITPDASSNVSKPCPLSKSMYPSVFLCVVCGADALDMPVAGEESIECSGCKQWCHAVCGRVTDVDSVSQVCSWLCPKCNFTM